MYGIYTYIWLIFMVNVGKYTIHGSYGKIHRGRFCFFFPKEQVAKAPTFVPQKPRGYWGRTSDSDRIFSDVEIDGFLLGGSSQLVSG